MKTARKIAVKQAMETVLILIKYNELRKRGKLMSIHVSEKFKMPFRVMQKHAFAKASIYESKKVRGTASKAWRDYMEKHDLIYMCGHCPVCQYIIERTRGNDSVCDHCPLHGIDGKRGLCDRHTTFTHRADDPELYVEIRKALKDWSYKQLMASIKKDRLASGTNN